MVSTRHGATPPPVAHDQRPTFEDATDLRGGATDIGIQGLLECIAEGIRTFRVDRPLQGLILERIVGVDEAVNGLPMVNRVHNLVMLLRFGPLLGRRHFIDVQLAPPLAPPLQ